jgi:hypothetical protein
MNGRVKIAAGVVVLAVGALGGTAAFAGGDRDEFSERLTGYEETPMTLSTTGNGKFHADVNSRRGEIDYRLKWADMEGTVTQAHIHLGARATSGGISVFLCSNVGNGPAGTQACPGTTAGAVSGTIRAADVIGPAGQGIAAMEFRELVRAMEAGATYVNVHTSKYGSGEIRGQLEPDKKR